MTVRIVLGPQRPETNLGEALASLGPIRAPLAVITAGWQEIEGDVDEMNREVGQPLVDLMLYHRAEELFAREPGLRDVYRSRQETLQELQRLYRLRLRQTMLAARQLLRADSDAEILRLEQRHAISQVRALDRHHLGRIRAVHSAVDCELEGSPRPALADAIAAIGSILQGCDAVLIAGGNVAVLLNRLRLFNLGSLMAGKHVIAWSAGAMAISDRVVLYHDNAPHGHRDAEVFESGLGLVSNRILLPDATQRLNLSERVGTALFCRRFAPASAITLDSGAMVRIENDRISAATGARRLTRSGRLRRVRTQ